MRSSTKSLIALMVLLCQSSCAAQKVVTSDSGQTLNPSSLTLSKVVSEKISGLSLASEEERRAVIEETKKWMKEAQVARPGLPPPTRPPFRTPTVNSRQSASIPLNSALRRLNLKALSSAAESPLRTAVQSLSPDGVSALKSRVLASQKCEAPVLAHVLAGKAEEAFPSPEAISEATELYAHAIRCGKDELILRASYRLSMIQIWQKRCKAALDPLETLIAQSAQSEYQSRALFWKAECRQALGDAKGAAQIREQLILAHPLSYHGMLARRSGPTHQQLWALPDDTAILLHSPASPAINRDLRRIEALLELGEKRWAVSELDRLVSRGTAQEPALRLYQAVLYNRADHYLGKFKVLTPLFRNSPELISLTSMRLFYPVRDILPGPTGASNTLLLHSLIRQESAFNEQARSRVGALGLMQIMPATGRSVASVGMSELLDPAINVRVGSQYLAELLTQFQGDTEMALAAYNAGPHRVENWLKRYPLDHRVLFLDLIPFKETREYVSSIARNYLWYTALYPAHVKSPMTIEKTFPSSDRMRAAL